MMRAALFVVVVSAVSQARAYAQPPLPGRLEVGFGVQWVGESSLGTSDANETTASGPPSRLFGTSTTLSSATGIEGRVAFAVTRSIDVEALATRATPSVRTAISNDIEAAAAVTATETIEQFTVGGGAVWYVPCCAGSRIVPFATASAHYVRQLHQGGTLAVTGRAFEFGGGAKFMLTSRSGSRFKGVGVRADARLMARSKGVAFDTQTRVAPALAASVFARF